MSRIFLICKRITSFETFLGEGGVLRVFELFKYFIIIPIPQDCVKSFKKSTMSSPYLSLVNL